MKPYYQDDYATIYLGDCRDVLEELSESISKPSLLFTDPPYGVALGSKKNNNRHRASYGVVVDNEEAVGVAVSVVASWNSRAVVTPGVRSMWTYPKPTHVGAWFHPAATGVNAWGFSCWQPIFYYGNDPYAGKGSRPDSFQVTEPAEQNGHPCPKPLRAWRQLLNRCSLDSDVVLDPFMGSGTTLRAAKDLGRKSIGIEIEEKYCEIAAKRLSQEVLDFGGAA